ncbi:MAG TPA: YceD family protein [Candidatus Limnocylindrales bacterium]|nr:YceD family protein [Candidatus Limnocylindrales bacterium]
MTARRPHLVDPHGDPLTLALAGLMGEAPGAQRTYEFRDVAISDPELPIGALLDGQARLTRTNRGLLLDATFATRLALECSRCLKAIDLPVELHLEEEVLPSIDISSGLPVRREEGEDPEAAVLNDHHELELRLLILEAISLVEPIAPLCEPGCPGLCAECGERLGPTHVEHEAEIDPRLEALRAFKVDDSERSG